MLELPQDLMQCGVSGSVQGLSESANLFEFVAYSIMLAYNFRLSMPCVLVFGLYIEAGKHLFSSYMAPME